MKRLSPKIEKLLAEVWKASQESMNRKTSHKMLKTTSLRSLKCFSQKFQKYLSSIRRLKTSRRNLKTLQKIGKLPTTAWKASDSFFDQMHGNFPTEAYKSKGTYIIFKDFRKSLMKLEKLETFLTAT